MSPTCLLVFFVCYDVILFSPYVVIELVIAAGIFPEGKQYGYDYDDDDG